MKKRRRIIGLLMLAIFLVGILSIVYVLEQTDYLELLPSHLYQVYMGGFFQLVMVVIYSGLIAFITPIIKDHSQTLSVYFVVSRSLSIGFHLIGLILLFLFVPLSHIYSQSPLQVYESIGELLRLSRDFINHIGVILPYLIGSSIFYYVLLKKAYISTWLIHFGFMGILLAGLSSLLILFNVISLVSPIFVILSLPLMLQEITLALFFIFKKKLHMDH